jgi:hypothetical protein
MSSPSLVPETRSIVAWTSSPSLPSAAPSFAPAPTVTATPPKASA